eukprot:6184369-Pleurochrysis_carterae.AAC.1
MPSLQSIIRCSGSGREQGRRVATGRADGKAGAAGGGAAGVIPVAGEGGGGQPPLLLHGTGPMGRVTHLIGEGFSLSIPRHQAATCTTRRP